MSLALSAEDRARLSGEQGEVLAFAMDMLVRAGEVLGADKFIDASFAHLDACHYYGQVHVDFAKFVVDGGATVSTPSWTNTVPANPQNPDLRSPEKHGAFLKGAHELMQLFKQMGCHPVWTCAPYQLPGGPGLGDQIVGSESNAVTYYNAVTGARTNKYGDFLDVCCALTGRVPHAGLHITENRRATALFTLADNIPYALRAEEEFAHVLGFYLGKNGTTGIPAIAGLPISTTHDALKGISAAVAASGGLQMFHAIGVTPEAPDLASAFQDTKPEAEHVITLDMVRQARADLSPVKEGDLNMVALGTPHFSYTEFANLMPLIEGTKIANSVTAYISTSRHVKALIEEKGWGEILERAGWQVIPDTCTYFGPPVEGCVGRVMSNSAKWAYYAPGLLGVEVAFGSLAECVTSANAGKLVRDDIKWRVNS
ncbi:MAG: aconitase X [Hyphomicrobiales bacterium]